MTVFRTSQGFELWDVSPKGQTIIKHYIGYSLKEAKTMFRSLIKEEDRKVL